MRNTLPHVDLETMAWVEQVALADSLAETPLFTAFAVLPRFETMCYRAQGDPMTNPSRSSKDWEAPSSLSAGRSIGFGSRLLTAIGCQPTEWVVATRRV